MGNVFLLLGPEKGLKEDFINKTKDSLGQFELSRFYSFEDYEEELLAQLNNNDLFADRKLVILCEAQEIKTAEKVRNIVDYIKHPSDSVTFLIESPELYINADIMSAVKPDNILKFYELFENKKTEWIRNFFRRQNLGISGSACDAITEKVENNIQEFEAVCSQIAIYLKSTDRNNVEESDVEDFLSHTKQETAFTLFGYIAKRDLEGALECLNALVNTNDQAEMSAVLAARLATFFRRALSVKTLMENGNSFEQAASAKYFETDRPIRMPKDKEVYRNATANYSLYDIKHILEKLAVYDTDIKESGTYLQQIIMEKILIDIVKRKFQN